MEIRIIADDEEETLDVTEVEHGTFRTTEEHRTKVTHHEGDTYTVIRGIQPTDSELLRDKDFVWLSGSLAGRGTPAGKFPLVYIPEGHGIRVETVK